MKLEQWCYVAAYIRSKLDELDSVNNASDNTEQAPDNATKRSKRTDAAQDFDNITLGSPQSPVTLAEFCASNSQNSKYSKFRATLKAFICENSSIMAPDSSTPLRMDGSTKVSPSP